MRKIFILLIILVFSIIISRSTKAQNLYDVSCGSFLFQPEQQLLSPKDGYFKPDRTDTINGVPVPEYAYFPVLIVFVQFLDDTSYDIWPNTTDTSGPIYSDSLIAFYKNNNSNWWNAYDLNKESFSNYFAQLSRGRFHVLGKAYSVRLDYYADYYLNNVTLLNEHIWNKLKQKYQVDWSFFDKWGYDANENKFVYAPDNNIDFIYKVHKATRGVLMEYDGYNALGGSDFKVDSLRWIRVNSAYTGSGITCARNIKKSGVMAVCIHEQGHFTFSTGHLIYGHNMYGIGNDAFYSPFEMIISKYIFPRNANLNQTNYLGDYSSRNNGDGEIIRVPISDKECFLLANRDKVCYWDRPMLGDTAFYDPYNRWEYGKGLYIYHVFDSIRRPVLDYCS